MESLYEIFQTYKIDNNASKDEGADAFKELESRYDRVKTKIDGCLAKIAGLEQEFPFNFAVMLDNDSKVEQRKKELQAQADEYMEQIRQLTGYLDMLLVPIDGITH